MWDTIRCVLTKISWFRCYISTILKLRWDILCNCIIKDICEIHLKSCFNTLGRKTFCRRHFQMCFCERKSFVFWFDFHRISNGQIDKPALVQVIAWHQSGDCKLTHICVASCQWISKTSHELSFFATIFTSYPVIFQAWPETGSDTWGLSGKSENVDVDGPCINTWTGSTYNALNMGNLTVTKLAIDGWYLVRTAKVGLWAVGVNLHKRYATDCFKTKH